MMDISFGFLSSSNVLHKFFITLKAEQDSEKGLRLYG